MAGKTLSDMTGEELLPYVDQFIGHRDDCPYGQSNPDGDFCTCRVQQNWRALRAEIMRRINGRPPAPPTTAEEK